MELKIENFSNKTIWYSKCIKVTASDKENQECVIVDGAIGFRTDIQNSVRRDFNGFAIRFGSTNPIFLMLFYMKVVEYLKDTGYLKIKARKYTSYDPYGGNDTIETEYSSNIAIKYHCSWSNSFNCGLFKRTDPAFERIGLSSNDFLIKFNDTFSKTQITQIIKELILLGKECNFNMKPYTALGIN